MPKGKLRLDDVLLACDLVKGNISRAAERLAVTRWALQQYLHRTPKARAAFDDWRRKLVDEAETALWDCVQEKQPWAIALVLKTLGKFRGYIEAKDLTPSGQCRLPQGERDNEGDEGRPGRRRAWSEPDALEDYDDAGPSADVLRDLWGQQEALIERQHAQLEAQAAEIQHLRAQLVAASAGADEREAGAEDLAVRAEVEALVAQVRRKLGQDDPA
jgi:hypothetical protein